MTESYIKWQHQRLGINSGFLPGLHSFSFSLTSSLYFFLPCLDTVFSYFFTSPFHMCLALLSFFCGVDSGWVSHGACSQSNLSYLGKPSTSHLSVWFLQLSLYPWAKDCVTFRSGQRRFNLAATHDSCLQASQMEPRVEKIQFRFSSWANFFVLSDMPWSWEAEGAGTV